MDSERAVGARRVNTELFAAHPPVLRPKDATWWKNPGKELHKLAGVGVVVSPTYGVYVVVPPQRTGDRAWKPTLEGFALALAQRLVGAQDAVLMGVSAARLHGALPRAVGTAVIAAPKQKRHSVQQTQWGDLFWIRRHADDMDIQHASTDLVPGWVTTIEQTLLDIADRPQLGRLDERTASEIIIALGPRADWDLVAQLSDQQRRRGAFARARWVADGVVDERAPTPSVPQHRDRYAPTLGLHPAVPTPAEPFGVHDPHGRGD